MVGAIPKKAHVAAAALALIVWLASPALCLADPAEVSVDLDYRLLSAWIGAERGQPLAPWTLQERRDGSRLVLASPVFSRRGDRLALQARLQLQREGRAVHSRKILLLQQPELQPAKGLLCLRTVERRYLDSAGKDDKPSQEASPFELQTLRGLDGFQLRLDPLQERVGALLAVSGNGKMPAKHAAGWGFGLSGVAADRSGLRLAVRFASVSDKPGKETGSEPQRHDRTKAVLVWDAFVTRLLCILHPASLKGQERDALLDLLLRERHACLPCLAGQSMRADLSLAHRFARIWSALEPIILRHLEALPRDKIPRLAALSVLADCLVSLEHWEGASPRWDMETLQEVAGWIDPQGRPLQCAFGCDRKLQQTLGVEPLPLGKGNMSPDAGGSGPPSKALSQPRGCDISTLSPFAPSAAHAAERPLPVDTSIIRKWLLEEQDLESYLGKARSLLIQCAAGAWTKGEIPFLDKGSFTQIVQATAWQESCFRQYDKEGEEIRFIRSYNRTSVGIMQVNEYVWRGIFDRQLLRWNIRYNAAAGAEIVHLYLMRYALQRLQAIQPLSRWSFEAIAGALYAMYVGGPNAFAPYIERWRTGRYRLTDRLFQEKLAWVLKGKWQNIGKCLDGEQKRD